MAGSSLGSWEMGLGFRFCGLVCVEDEESVFHINHNSLPFANLTGEELHRHWVHDLLLDGSLQRSCTISWVESCCCQVRECLFAEFQCDVPLS